MKDKIIICSFIVAAAAVIAVAVLYGKQPVSAEQKAGAGTVVMNGITAETLNEVTENSETEPSVSGIQKNRKPETASIATVSAAMASNANASITKASTATDSTTAESVATSSDAFKKLKQSTDSNAKKVLNIVEALPPDATPGQIQRLPHPITGGYIENEYERGIYSFVQIPKSFYVSPEWAGDWTDIEAGGQKFFYFGCGVCCLSNVYSTLTGEIATPDVMFGWTKEYTDYNPDSGVGAVSWGQLQRMCQHFGFAAEIKDKPEDYAVFQSDVQNAETTIVLVCKEDDDKLWFYTKGHYVNLWNYDAQSDTVFVTDASGLFNRARLNLIDIYNALKTSSDAQYMTIKKSE